jgi:hypothetical protein
MLDSTFHQTELWFLSPIVNIEIIDTFIVVPDSLPPSPGFICAETEIRGHLPVDGIDNLLPDLNSLKHCHNSLL